MPWIRLEGEEYDRVWSEFCARFQFRPSVQSTDWPGILEPKHSETFAIDHVYSRDRERYKSLTDDLGVKLIGAFRKVVTELELIYALDWHHDCYMFEPHEKLQFQDEDDWPVPPLPNGDYYIFLTKDLNCGVFGHPWEKTMCVFGRALVEAISVDSPILFDRMIRRGGTPLCTDK